MSKATNESGMSKSAQTEQRLQELQTEYMKPDCPQDVRDEFFMLLKDYTRSILLGRMKNKVLRFDAEKVDALTLDVMLTILKQYKKPGWKITGSFGGYTKLKIQEVLFNKNSQLEDKTVSLSTKLGEGEDSNDLSSNIAEGNVMANSPDFQVDDISDKIIHDYNTCYDTADKLLDEAYTALPYDVYLKFLPWFLLQLRKPRLKNGMDNFNTLFLSNKEQQAFDLLLMEFRNRVYENAGE